MNFKKFISGVSAFAIAASAFAGMAVTANAATPTYTWDITNASWDVTADMETAGVTSGYVCLESGASTAYWFGASVSTTDTNKHSADNVDANKIYIPVASNSATKEAGNKIIGTKSYYYVQPGAEGLLQISTSDRGFKANKTLTVRFANGKSSNSGQAWYNSLTHRIDNANTASTTISSKYALRLYEIHTGDTSTPITNVKFYAGGTATYAGAVTALNDGEVYTSDENAEDDGSPYAKAYTVNVTGGYYDSAKTEAESYKVAIGKSGSDPQYSGVLTGDAVIGFIATADTAENLNSVTKNSFVEAIYVQ